MLNLKVCFCSVSQFIKFLKNFFITPNQNRHKVFLQDLVYLHVNVYHMNASPLGFWKLHRMTCRGSQFPSRFLG